MSKDVVNELNAFLKGQYMGIHTYDNYIQKVEDPKIKKEFQKIQQDHKRHAAQVAERIQNLGGRAVDDEGVVMSMKQVVSEVKGPPDSTKDFIKSALKGEDYYGIHMSKEIVKGDLDAESKKIIDTILNEDQKHVDLLNSLLQ